MAARSEEDARPFPSPPPTAGPAGPRSSQSDGETQLPPSDSPRPEGVASHCGVPSVKRRWCFPTGPEAEGVDAGHIQPTPGLGCDGTEGCVQAFRGGSRKDPLSSISISLPKK